MEIEMDVLAGDEVSGTPRGEFGDVSDISESVGGGVGAVGAGEAAINRDSEGSEMGERKRKNGGRTQLVIHNSAWKSWIPAVGSALLLVSLGIFFLFVQFEAWTVHSIVSLVLVANGLVLLTKTRKETCTFDQAKGKLTIRRTTWRGRKITRHWLMQIKEVRVEEYRDPQGGTDYELYLFLRSGQRVKIFSGHLIGVGSRRKLQARDDIVDFLEEFSKKYTTKSRASHSGLKGYMKKQLSGALTPARATRRRGRSTSLNKGQNAAASAAAATASVAGVGLMVPCSPTSKRHRSTSLNPGTSKGRSRADSDVGRRPPSGES